ncbi:MAG: SIS domain-containing protein [Phycisphaerales bacterium]|nr:MAG: SIS domain-containing protein [Phycisphaerales bacterium]
MNTWNDNLTEWDRLRASLSELETSIGRTGRLLIETLRADKKILACGNGGSAAQASHLCTELVGRYRRQRRSLGAVCLSADGPLLTCIANDFDPADVFARQVQGLGQPGDCLVGLTTSGASQNIARALRAARERGLGTVALLGRCGDPAAKRPACDVAEHEIIIPSTATARIQEAHLLIIHTWCDMIDGALG